MPGVSDSFASALWALNALFAMARVNVDGVNLQTRLRAQQAVRDREVHGRWQAQVSPVYYGAMMFAQAAPAGSRLLAISGTAGANVNGGPPARRTGRSTSRLSTATRSTRTRWPLSFPGAAPPATLGAAAGAEHRRGVGRYARRTELRRAHRDGAAPGTPSHHLGLARRGRLHRQAARGQRSAADAPSPIAPGSRELHSLRRIRRQPRPTQPGLSIAGPRVSGRVGDTGAQALASALAVLGSSLWVSRQRTVGMIALRSTRSL